MAQPVALLLRRGEFVARAAQRVGVTGQIERVVSLEQRMPVGGKSLGLVRTEDFGQRLLTLFLGDGGGQPHNDLLEKILSQACDVVPCGAVVGGALAARFGRNGKLVTQREEHGQLHLQVFRHHADGRLAFERGRVVK